MVDVDIFNFVKKSIAGGLSNSLKPYEKLENDNQCIAMMDIASQYPDITRKKFQSEIIDLFKDLMKTDMVKIKIMDVYCCVMYKTTDRIRNDPLTKTNSDVIF